MDFQKFDKIPRLSRDIVITEKIDGTNAQIYICSPDELRSNHGEDNKKTLKFLEQYCLHSHIHQGDDKTLYIFAGSRKKWLDTSSKGDNFGFAKWVEANGKDLIKLGEGRHYGEWYGLGIQRNYGLDEKRFALFNVAKWSDNEVRPKCCEVVPTLYRGEFNTIDIKAVLADLKMDGSSIAPSFMNPEGIIIYHTASGRLFKKTILNDEKPKESNEQHTRTKARS